MPNHTSLCMYHFVQLLETYFLTFILQPSVGLIRTVPSAGGVWPQIRLDLSLFGILAQPKWSICSPAFSLFTIIHFLPRIQIRIEFRDRRPCNNHRLCVPQGLSETRFQSARLSLSDVAVPPPVYMSSKCFCCKGKS